MGDGYNDNPEQQNRAVALIIVLGLCGLFIVVCGAVGWLILR